MRRCFVVEHVYDVDSCLYEVYPVPSIFSYVVYSDIEILPFDVIVVYFDLFSPHVIKIVRNGEVIYDVQS